MGLRKWLADRVQDAIVGKSEKDVQSVQDAVKKAAKKRNNGKENGS